MTLLISLVLLAAVASPISFLLMWWDKRAAQRGARRVPEVTLHTLELLGGWPGSLAAQRLFRHKTAKVKYRVFFALATVAHVAICVAAVVMMFTQRTPL